jgi:DnaK suppressor protein
MKTRLDVESIRKKLEENRAVLSLRLREEQNVQDGVRMANPDRSSLAQDYVSKERQAAINERLEETLEQVEAALARLDDGTYGECTNCGEDISPDRLMTLPYAELCVECQQEKAGIN